MCALSRNSVVVCPWATSISVLALGGDPVGSEGVENNGRNWQLRRGGPLVLCGICCFDVLKELARDGPLLRRETG